MACKQGGGPAGVDGADLWPDLSELGGVGGNRQVAERREYVSATDGKSVDTRDDGLRHIAGQSLKLVDWQSDDTAAVILSLVSELVPPGAELLVASACQHNARNVSIVGGEVESLNQFFQGL